MKIQSVIVALLCLLLVSGALAQNPVPPQPGTVFQVSSTWPMMQPPVGPQIVNVQQVGAPGSSALTYYYWAVSRYGWGNSSPVGPVAAYNANSTLDSSNYFKIFITAAPGETSHDLLRTSTPAPPTGACACAVATASTASVISDQSNSLSAYTVTTLDPNSLQLFMQNEPQSGGGSHLILRQGLSGTFIVDLNTLGTSGITGSGTANRLPVFTAPTVIGNSTLTTSTAGALTDTATTGTIGASWSLSPTSLAFNPNTSADATISVSGAGNSINLNAAAGTGAGLAGGLVLNGGNNTGNTGANISVNGAGVGLGGDIVLNGGTSTVGRGGQVSLSPGGSSAGRGGDVILAPAAGNTAANHGVIYVSASSNANDPRYIYFGPVTFANLATPATNPQTGLTLGARIYCTDCVGAQDGGLSGSIATNSGPLSNPGTGTALIYDGTHWRVLGGLGGGAGPVVNASGGALGTALKTIAGSVTLNTPPNTVTFTGGAGFSTTGYACTGSDQTANATFSIAHTSASSITVDGTNTHVINYVCIGPA